MKTESEKLNDLMQEAAKQWMDDGRTDFYIDFAVDYLISKGVTIPVRCGECEYRTSKGECRRLGHPPLIPQDDFYCKAGKRKKDVPDTKYGNKWARIMRTFLGDENQ